MHAHSTSPFRRRHPRLVNWGLPTLFFAAFTILATWPMARDLRHATAYAPGDGLLNAWILRWNLHQLAHAPLQLFHAPIMHPSPYTLALSENMLGLSLLFAPLDLIFDDTLILANTVIMFSFFSLGLVSFHVFRRWTGSWWIGLMAGLLIGFAPTRMARLLHIQLLSYQPTVLAVYFGARWLRSARWRDAAALFASMAVQFLFGVYLFVFMEVFLFFFMPACALAWRRRLAWRRLAIQGLAGALALGMVIYPLSRPYQFIRKAWGITAQKEFIIESSVTVTDFLKFPGANLLHGKWAMRFTNPYSRFPWEQEVALPLTAYALAAAGLAGGVVLLLRRRRWLRGQWLWLAGTLAGLVCLSLMFGPLLHLAKQVYPGIPMPYNLLVHIVPGLEAVRGMSRFILPASIGIAMMGLLPLGWAARVLGRRRPRLAVALLVTLTLAMAAESLNAPLYMYAVPGKKEIPESVRRLAALPPGPVLHWPIVFEREFDFIYMYYQTYCWQPMINGRSGYTPPDHLTMMFKLVPDFPSREGLATLKKLGVKYVLVHGDFLASAGRQGDLAKMASLEKQKLVQTIFQNPQDRIIAVQ